MDDWLSEIHLFTLWIVDVYCFEICQDLLQLVLSSHAKISLGSSILLKKKAIWLIGLFFAFYLIKIIKDIKLIWDKKDMPN